jgi:DNA-binding XRE family transcriptional regulator
MKKTLEQRFWENVDKRGPDECWLWTGGTTNNDKNGEFWISFGRLVSAVKFAYALSHNKKLNEVEALIHTCKCGKCCNPNHIKARTPENVFWSNVKKLSNEQCWEWTGCLDGNGYGTFTVDGKVYKAHRFSLEIHKGVIPEGMVSRHMCHNRKCSNPHHLEIGTPRDNSYDTIRAGRYKCKPRLNGTKPNVIGLTFESVKEIINRYNSSTVSALQLAKEYHVSSNTVHAILTGKIWCDVPGERHASLSKLRGGTLEAKRNIRDSEIANEFRALRRSAGLRAEEVAIFVGINYRAIQEYEGGRRRFKKDVLDKCMEAINTLMASKSNSSTDALDKAA